MAAVARCEIEPGRMDRRFEPAVWDTHRPRSRSTAAGRDDQRPRWPGCRRDTVETGPLTHSEEEDMSFRDRARQRLQNRAQLAQPEDDQEPQNGPPEDGQEQPSGQ